jgi:hypothetical protein
MRWMLLALFPTVTAVTACSTGTAKPATAVQETVSGLRPGGKSLSQTQGLPGGSATGFTPTRPGAGANDPPDILLGDYSEVVMGVLDAHPDRTDLVVGAERTVRVEAARVGWLMDGFIGIEALNGRFSGAGDRFEADPEYDCWMEVSVQVEGMDGRSDRFRLFVEEQVIVSGKECGLSELGPLRWEENRYRVQMIGLD